MNKKVLVFFILITVGSLVLVGYYLAKPYLQANKNKFSSDAAETKGTIVIGVDNWIGYFPLCSKQMKTLLRGAGYLLECKDDNADYPGRMKALKEQQLNFAVASVDSYILNGMKEDFPGTIVAIIDESKGGDALIGNEKKFTKLEDLKKNEAFKIAFTPHSPSEHILRGISVHFDIPKLREKKGSWRVETDGSTQALKKLMNGSVDAAVLWEPDVSKAINEPGFIKLLGTEDTKKLIVDVLLVEREFSKNNPDVVAVVLSNYFRALKHYKSNPQELIAEVKEKSDLSEELVVVMLKGVHWVNLFDNAQAWFGIAGTSSVKHREGLIETIQDTIDILINTNEISESPLPENNPYYLQNKKFIDVLFNSGFKTQFGVSDSGGETDLTRSFSPLSSAEWENLREVGKLKIRPITFQSGTSSLDSAGEEQLRLAIKNLEHYPNFRVIIKGHTGLKGDPVENRKLSQERAEAVLDYMVKTFQIDKNRLQALGIGSDAPLPRDPDESDRAYNYRLPRVELGFVSEVY